MMVPCASTMQRVSMTGTASGASVRGFLTATGSSSVYAVKAVRRTLTLCIRDQALYMEGRTFTPGQSPHDS